MGVSQQSNLAFKLVLWGNLQKHCKYLRNSLWVFMVLLVLDGAWS